jgi:hypothetical protein
MGRAMCACIVQRNDDRRPCAFIVSTASLRPAGTLPSAGIFPSMQMHRTLTSSRSRCFILKSIPMVVMNVGEKLSYAYLTSRHVLPTPVSPSMSSLMWMSCEFCWLLLPPEGSSSAAMVEI